MSTEVIVAMYGCRNPASHAFFVAGFPPRFDRVATVHFQLLCGCWACLVWYFMEVYGKFHSGQPLRGDLLVFTRGVLPNPVGAPLQGALEGLTTAKVFLGIGPIFS